MNQGIDRRDLIKNKKEAKCFRGQEKIAKRNFA